MNPESIDDALGGDHQLLGGLLERLRGAVASASAAAGDLLLEFGRGLRRHMTWEEETLFPAVSARATGAQKRSIESLEIDHERLRETLDHLSSTLAAGDFAAAEAQVRWLETLLQGHNYDEEHGVYVEADHYLSTEERRRMLDRFRAP